MQKADASLAGTFKIGGDTTINRLGFGAMRVTGNGIWGEPADRAESVRTLKHLRDVGVNFVDTADSYGPDVSEELIAEALHPYSNMLIATKAGIARTGPNKWPPVGRPEYLIQQAYKSLRNLGVDQIGLWQLHQIDPKVPRDEQFDAVKTLLDDGVIKHAGLSNVSVEEIEAASKVFAVATVQNRYNLVNRAHEAVLNHCVANGIGFVAWSPLAAGNLAKSGSLLDRVAAKHKATPGQIALAWMLKRAPVMLPIPGTAKVDHLDGNVASTSIDLTDDDYAALEAEGRAEYEASRK